MVSYEFDGLLSRPMQNNCFIAETLITTIAGVRYWRHSKEDEMQRDYDAGTGLLFAK